MSFKLEKKHKELIEIYGQQIEITKPTVGQLAQFQAAAKKEGFNEVEESLSFLESIGVPKNILADLIAEDYQALIEYIFTPKKK